MLDAAGCEDCESTPGAKLLLPQSAVASHDFRDLNVLKNLVSPRHQSGLKAWFSLCVCVCACCFELWAI